MEKYEMEEYTILSAKDVRLKDENDIYWYPIGSFFRKMLFKDIRPIWFRDKPFYENHMKVIEYIHPNSDSGKPEKTWFMDAEGIHQALKNFRVKIDGSKKTLLMREKYLAAARSFFGVSVVDDIPTFIGFTPDLSEYDVWSILCIQKDTTITKDTLWQRCSTCGFYYPYTERYFQKYKTRLSVVCKECGGNHFVCQNKRIQFIKNNGGLDLLYQYYLEDDKKILEEFKKWILGGGL